MTHQKHVNNSYKNTNFIQPMSDVEWASWEGTVNGYITSQFEFTDGEGRSRFEDLFLRHAKYIGNDGRKYMKFYDFHRVFVHKSAEKHFTKTAREEEKKAHLQFWEDMYRMADHDHDGLISFADFVEFAEMLESNDCVAKMIWRQMDSDGDGLISKEKWNSPLINGEYPFIADDIFKRPDGTYRSFSYEDFLAFLRERQDLVVLDKYRELKDLDFGVSHEVFFMWVKEEVKSVQNENIRYRITEMAYNANPHGVTFRTFCAWHRLIHNVDGLSLALDPFIGFERWGRGPFKYRRDLPTQFRLINFDLQHACSKEQIFIALNTALFQSFKWVDLGPIMQILDINRDNRIDLREMLSYKKALHNDGWLTNFKDPVNLWYQGLAASFLSVPFVYTVLRFHELSIPFRNFNLENFKLAYFGAGWGRFINTAWAHIWYSARHLGFLHYGYRRFQQHRTEEILPNMIAGLAGGLAVALTSNPCENRVISEELSAVLGHSWNPGRYWTIKKLGWGKFFEGAMFGAGIQFIPLGCVFFPLYAKLRAGLESPEGSISWQRLLLAGSVAGYAAGYVSNMFMTYGETWQKSYRALNFNEWALTGRGGRSVEKDLWKVWDQYFRLRVHRQFFHIGRTGGVGGVTSHVTGLKMAMPLGLAAMYVDYSFWTDHKTQKGPTCTDNYSSKHRRMPHFFSMFSAMDFFEPIRLQAQVRKQELSYLLRCVTKPRFDSMTSFVASDKSSF